MSRLVFKRRDIQKRIDDLLSIIAREKLSEIIRRLNRYDESRLPTMWEVIILHALSKCGSLLYEPTNENGKNPDFRLEIADQENGELTIVGDITAASDSGLHENNPIDFFAQRLQSSARSAGLDWWLFQYNIPGHRTGKFGDARVKLNLPNKADIERIFHQEIAPWMMGIKQDPSKIASFKYGKDAVDISLDYCPTRTSGGGGYTSYTVSLSKTKNPLYAALKSKVKQLKGNNLADAKIIIVCDGGSALLRRKAHLSHDEYSGREVACDFLRQNRSIDAVLLVGISEERGLLDTRTKLGVTYDLVMAPVDGAWTDRQKILIPRLERIVGQMALHLPNPISTAYNAATNCRTPGFGNGAIGGYTVSGGKIKISSLALHKLLAGEINLEDFYDAHGWSGEGKKQNPFNQMLKQGRMISGIGVEEVDSTDDDWLNISFGETDPAIFKFLLK
jgi:hypothetical protein